MFFVVFCSNFAAFMLLDHMSEEIKNNCRAAFSLCLEGEEMVSLTDFFRIAASHFNISREDCKKWVAREQNAQHILSTYVGADCFLIPVNNYKF